MRSRRLRSIVLAGCALAGFAANSSAQFVASWTSAASGTWTNAANWSTNPVFPNNNSPAVGDTYYAVIDAIGPAYTVTLDSPITLNSLHLNSPSATLQQNGGTLTLLNGGTISAGTYSVNAGAIYGPGPLNIAGGVLAISGLSTIRTSVTNHGMTYLSSSTLTINNGTFENKGLFVIGSPTLGSSINSIGTSLLTNTGTILVTASESTSNQISVPLVNAGTIMGNSGRLTFSEGTHLAGATISGPGTISLVSAFLAGTLKIAGENVQVSNLAGPGDLDVTGRMNLGIGTFAGNGAINILPGGRVSMTANLTRTLSRTLNNSGTFAINLGSLQLNGGTLNNLATGVIEYSSSAPFGSSGSTNLVNNAGTIRFGGAGALSFSFNAPLVNSGTILVNSTSLSAPTGSTHNGNAYIGGTGTLSLDRPTVNGRLILAARSTTLSGTLLGSGTLDIASSVRFFPITLSGTGVTNVLAGASTSGSFTLSRTLNNAGMMNVGTSSSAVTFNNGTFNNLAGGMFIAEGTGFAVGAGTSNAMTNAGTLMFNSLNGGGNFVVPLTNSGTIHAIGTAQFSIGTVTHLAGSTLIGPGTISLGNVTHRVNGTLALAGNIVHPMNAILTGAGNIDLTGTLNYSGGQVIGPGVVNIASSGNYNVLTNPGSTVSRAIINSGRINLTSGVSLIPSATLTNQAGGVIAIPVGSISFGPFTNFGTIQVIAAGGTATLQGGSAFRNQGALFANGGTVTLADTLHFGGATIGGSAPIVLANTPATIGVGFATTLAGSNMILNGDMTGSGNTFMAEDESLLTGTLNWNSGTITQTGGPNFPISLHVMPGAVLNAVGSSSRGLGRSLRNDGTINFVGGTTSWSAGSITNSAGGVMNFGAISSFGNTFVPPVGSQFINGGILNFSPLTTLRFGPNGGGGSFTNSSGTIIVNSGTVLLGITKVEGDSHIGGAGTAVLSVATLNGSLALDGKSFWNSIIPVNGTGSLLINHQTFLQEGDFRNTGGVHIAPDAEFYVGLSAQTFGTATVRTTIQNAGFTRVLNGRISDGGLGGAGTLNNLATGILNFAEGAAFEGNVTLNNAGRVNVSSGTINITSPVNNTGTLAINAGSTALTGAVTQLQGNALTGGNWIVGPVAQLHLAAGATISLNQANVELLSPFAHFPALNALQENSGTFSLRLGRSFTAAGSFTNSGVINIDSGGALFVNDALFNSGTINGLVIQTGSSTLSGNSYIKTLRGGDVFVEASSAARVDYLDAGALSIASQSDLTLGAGSIAHVIDILNIAPADGTLSAGRLDLLSGRLVIDYTGSSPADTFSQLLATGFNNGDWLGRGITSSSILTGSNFAIGMIESAELFSMGGTFAGVNVDNTALLLDRTLKGDANLDYTVNISDFAIVAANFNAPTKWSKGDFNYDNITNIADFALLAANFNQSLPADLPRQSIPEPCSIGGLIMLASAVARRFC